MAVYAIGDLQGCFGPWQALLTACTFEPGRDRLWLAGDLVNRGPQSREVLALAFSLRELTTVVLGNHDLYALARWCRLTPPKRSDTLDTLLSDPACEEWMDWLRRRPFLHHDADLRWTLVHAAIHPDWDLEQALGHAQAIEAALGGPHWQAFLRDIWENPAPQRWEDCKSEADAMRFRVAVFTRARLMRPDGIYHWPADPPAAPADWQPWHEIYHERYPEMRIVCGHWATQGLRFSPWLLALDTGCVWGGTLTSARLDREPPEIRQVPCPRSATPKA